MRSVHVLAGLMMVTPCMALNAEETKSPWTFTAGGSVLVSPEFPGSGSAETLPLPALSVMYRDRWFLNGDGLGAFFLRNGGWALSASVAADLAHRDESDAAYLRGTGDVDRTAVARVKGAYRFGVVTASLSMSTDIANEHHGTVAEFSLQAQSRLTPRLSLHYGAAGRWTDDEYAETFFGITPQQSLDSGLPRYVAASGIGDVRTFVNAVYGIDSRWILNTGFALGQLQGDAADSPIVEDDTFFIFNAALMYRF